MEKPNDQAGKSGKSDAVILVSASVQIKIIAIPMVPRESIGGSSNGSCTM